MRIGYACITIEVPNTGMRTCLLKNVSEEKLLELILHNLNSLENMIDYNIKNDIRLFRISSDLIPFGSSHVNKIPWWDVYRSKLSVIGDKIKNNGIRVSMHPGQYTILNSPDKDVVNRAIQDLSYHSKVLDSLGVGMDHKIVLHIGGVYGDKLLAAKRFVTNFKHLPVSITDRIVLENDDKSFPICDVLEIGSVLIVPVVFDNLHNKVNPCSEHMNDVSIVNECKNTWKKKDGVQKIHYSQQDPNKRPGSHSNSIFVDEFINFIDNLGRDDIDIMLEVKDKNLSALNCIRRLSSENRYNPL